MPCREVGSKIAATKYLPFVKTFSALSLDEPRKKNVEQERTFELTGKTLTWE